MSSHDGIYLPPRLAMIGTFTALQPGMFKVCLSLTALGFSSNSINALSSEQSSADSFNFPLPIAFSTAFRSVISMHQLSRFEIPDAFW
jgi:hypothetical protein